MNSGAYFIFRYNQGILYMQYFGDQPDQYAKRNQNQYNQYNNYNPNGYYGGPYTPNQNYTFQENHQGQLEQSFTSQTTSPAMVSDLYGNARKQFIKKVYIILSCQLLFTVFLTGLSMTSQSFFKFQIQHVGLLYMAIIIALIIEIYVFCCQGGRTFPSNIITTSIFTLCEGYVVSFICSATGKTSGNQIVFLAALMTLTITVACTLYAIFTDSDFTTCGALLAVVAGLMFIIFIILLFTSSPFLHIIYCALGVFLASIYIIIDTQMIVGGKSVQLTVDQYFFGALLLYIDIITLFLYLLELLKSLNSQN